MASRGNQFAEFAHSDISKAVEVYISTESVEVDIPTQSIEASVFAKNFHHQFAVSSKIILYQNP